jgi:1-acyl-sn-glycerol-3-phosphate acyltransferase
MAYWILKVILTPLLRCLYRLDVSGTGNVPEQGPVIVASNHQSFIDSIFLALVVRRRVTFVAKAEYFDTWRTAWFFRAAGQIPLRRGGGPAGEQALTSARDVLDAGGVLGIYPEGTRSPDGRLYKGHTGVARLALATGATVVPVALDGTAGVQPIGSMFPRPFRRVRITIGAPLGWPGRSAEADDPAAQREVTDRIMAAIAQLSGQQRVDRYAKRARPAGAGPAGDPRRDEAVIDLSDTGGAVAAPTSSLAAGAAGSEPARSAPLGSSSVGSGSVGSGSVGSGSAGSPAVGKGLPRPTPSERRPAP